MIIEMKYGDESEDGITTITTREDERRMETRRWRREKHNLDYIIREVVVYIFRKCEEERENIQLTNNIPPTHL